MSRFCTLSAAALMVALASCAPQPLDLEAQRSALMKTSRDWAQAAGSGDLDRIVAYWADDAIVLPPDQPAVVGKAAIRDYVAKSMEIPGFSVTWEPEQASVAANGEMGYLIERNRFTFPDSSGATQTQFGKGVTVWRKDATGAWKCVIDTWNANPTERVLPLGK